MSDILNTKQLYKIAQLTKLIVTSEEEESLAFQLGTILTFVSHLQSVPTKNVEPTAQVTGLANVYREDVVDQSRMLTQKQALKNAKETKNGYFVVPSVWT